MAQLQAMIQGRQTNPPTPPGAPDAGAAAEEEGE